MKRIFSLFLSLILVLSLFAGLTAADAADGTFTDVPASHWASSYISYLAQKKILVGDGNGQFRPNASVTRAEFIKMIDEIFGLDASVPTTFTKVPAWASEYIGRAKRQGFLLDYAQDDDFSQALSREEAVALIMRYLNITDTDPLKTNFSDYYTVDVRYRDYVVQAINERIISGYEDGTFRPKNTLTRAEALTILYKAAGAIYDQTSNGDSAGAAPTNAVIKSSAALYNLHLSGRIIIGEDVKSVTFTDCIITGKIYVRGGTSVSFNNCSVPYVDFLGEPGELRIAGSSVIKKAQIDNTTSIRIEEKTKIETLIINVEGVGTKIDGKGTIDTIVVYASGINTGSILPAAYTIGRGLTAVFAGTTYTEGSGKTSSVGFTSAYVSGYSKWHNSGASTAPQEKYVVYVRFTAAQDGFVHCAVWRNSDPAPDGKGIMEASISAYGYGSYLYAKAGETYELEIEVLNHYSNYNVGLVLMEQNGSMYNKTAAVVYNQGEITEKDGSMGPEAPKAVAASGPSWNVDISSDEKSIVVMFDQVVYVKDSRGALIPLSSLKQNDLLAVFALEVTPANKIDDTPDFSVAVYEGPITLVYLTPKDGVFAGEYYYVFVLEDLYNSQGGRIDTYYNSTYVR